MSVDATGSGTAISPDQFTQLMEAITAFQTRMDEKFSEFQVEVRQGQEEAAVKALKRARYEKPYTFKRKGNEEQATFNAPHPSSERSAILMSFCRAAIIFRPFLMASMARCSAGAPADASVSSDSASATVSSSLVVAEYTTDELAEDSDDEKRLERAEKAAEQKAAKRRKKRTIGQLGKPRGSLRPTTPGVPVAAATTVPAPPFYRAGARSGTATPRPGGPCFGCGEMGHLRAHCPKAAGTAESRKWYPFVGNDSSDDVRVDYQHDTVEGTTFEGEDVDSGPCVDSESMGRSWEVDTEKSLATMCERKTTKSFSFLEGRITSLSNCVEYH